MSLKLKVIHATANCANSTCPTIYKTADGSYVVQGFTIKPEDKAGISLPEGEDAVILPEDFVKQFLLTQQEV